MNSNNAKRMVSLEEFEVVFSQAATLKDAAQLLGADHESLDNFYYSCFGMTFKDLNALSMDHQLALMKNLSGYDTENNLSEMFPSTSLASAQGRRLFDIDTTSRKITWKIMTPVAFEERQTVWFQFTITNDKYCKIYQLKENEFQTSNQAATCKLRASNQIRKKISKSANTQIDQFVFEDLNQFLNEKYQNDFIQIQKAQHLPKVSAANSRNYPAAAASSSSQQQASAVPACNLNSSAYEVDSDTASLRNASPEISSSSEHSIEEHPVGSIFLSNSWIDDCLINSLSSTSSTECSTDHNIGSRPTTPLGSTFPGLFNHASVESQTTDDSKVNSPQAKKRKINHTSGQA